MKRLIAAASLMTVYAFSAASAPAFAVDDPLSGPSTTGEPTTAPRSPAGSASDSNVDLARVQPYVQPSVVFLDLTVKGWAWDRLDDSYLTDAEGDLLPVEMTSHCTGFVVNPNGYIQTAAHCVDPEGFKADLAAEALRIDQARGNYEDATAEDAVQIYEFDGTQPAYDTLRTPRGVNVPELVVAASWGTTASGQPDADGGVARVLGFVPYESGDVGLVKVEKTGLPALELTSEDDVTSGTPIASVGFGGIVDSGADADYSPSFKKGTVSQKRTKANGAVPVYELDVEINGGMSGGPIVDASGRVVGVNSYGFASTTTTFGAPASLVRELLAQYGVENVVDQSAQDYRRGLDAYFAGDKTTAISALESVVAANPAHALAHEYLSKARELTDTQARKSDVADDAVPAASEKLFHEEDSNSVLWIALGIAAVAVAVGCGGSALAFRRRRPQPTLAAYGSTLSPTSVPMSTPVHAAAYAGQPPVMPVTTPTVRTVRSCVRCGTEVDIHHSFCGRCGSTMPNP